MAGGSIRPSEPDYPNIYDDTLPVVTYCAHWENEENALRELKRYCPKDLEISYIEPRQATTPPICHWKVFYKLKNEEQYKLDNPYEDIISQTTKPKCFASVRYQVQCKCTSARKDSATPLEVFSDWEISDICESDSSDSSLEDFEVIPSNPDLALPGEAAKEQCKNLCAAMNEKLNLKHEKKNETCIQQ